MSQSRERGSVQPRPTQSDSNGFVNRLSPVQVRASAHASKNPKFTRESARAAVKLYLAGRVTARTAHAALTFLLSGKGIAARVASRTVTPAQGIAEVRAVVGAAP